MRQLGLVALMALVSQYTLAQSEVLDLGQVVRQGLAFSPIVKMAEATWNGTKATTNQAEKSLFPSIDLVTSGTFQKNPTRVGTSLTSNSDEIYSSALKLTQPLYRGGLLTNGIASANLNERIAEQSYISARQLTVAALVSAYYSLASAERRLAVAEDQRNVLQAYSQIVSRYEKIGRSRKMERLQASVNLSLGEAKRVIAERERTIASDNLKRLLGFENTDKPLSGRLQLVIAPAAPVALDQALAAAVAGNPDYKAFELKVQKQDYDNELELVEDFPSLNLEAQYGFRAPERPGWFEESSRFQSVGLNLVIPLFSGFTSMSKRQRHVQNIKFVRNQLEDQRLVLRQKLQNSLVNLSSEYTRLTAAESAATLGREALRLANSAYGQGTASSQDVLNAQQTRFESESLLIESQFSYLNALLSLRQLMGVDLEKIYGK